MDVTYHIVIGILIFSSAILGIRLQKIDVRGGIIGILLALIIWIGSGEITLLSLFIFFVVGTLASSWKKEMKVKLKLDQEHDGKRGAQNVLANGGTAGIWSFFAFMFPEYHLILFIMTLTSLATACSDTLSSELGNIYGKKFFNILTLASDNRGKDGVVSMEGFLFGIIGSLIIAVIPMLIHSDWEIMLIILVSGFFGNLIDSILGATLQQNGKLSNHGVNFWSTFMASIISSLLFTLIKT